MDRSKFNDMSIIEIVNYLTDNFHIPLKNLLDKRWGNIVGFSNKHNDDYPKVKHLKDLYGQLENEILKHMKKEDDIMFPMIIDYENNKLDLSNEEIINKIDIVDGHKMESEHEIFQYYLNTIIELLGNCEIVESEDVPECNEIREEFIKINEDLQEHIYLEDIFIYKKWKEIEKKADGK